MKDKYDNSKKQGDAGLGVAIGWFAAQGITVCVPLTDSQDYDLVVDLDGLKRVQVRTTYSKNCAGTYKLNLRVCGGNRSGCGKIKNFDSEKVDLIFAVTGNRKCYLIPADKIKAVNQLALNGKVEQYICG